MIEDLFFGECTNIFECRDCNRSTQMPEKILDLSVNFRKKKIINYCFIDFYLLPFYFLLLFPSKMMIATLLRKVLTI